MLRVRSILGNAQKLDGGAMFGNAPRARWSRWCVPDEQHRIRIASRVLLVEDGQRRVLLEAGMGACFEPRLRERYGVEGERNQLLDALASVRLNQADIDVVILSHLHFDHAGGLLPGHAEQSSQRLLFPNARYVVSRAAFERACQPHPRDRASFIQELPALLQESQRLVLVDTDSPPPCVIDQRYRWLQTEGHTPGMLHTEIVGQAQRLFFAADLIPGTPWLHLPISMGYDRFPERLIDEKASVLERMEATAGWLCFYHDAVHAMARVRTDARGRYCPVDLGRTLDLDLDCAL